MRAAVVFAFAIALLALVSSVHAGMYSSSDPVTVLTDANFDSLVTKSKETWVVEFYSDGCGHCHSFKDAYLASAKSMLGVARYGVLDGAANRSTMSKFGVQGFPTVKIFSPDAKTPTDFQGAREAKALSQAVLKSIREMISARLNGGTPKTGGAGKADSGAKFESKGGSVIELNANNFKAAVNNPTLVTIVKFFAPWCGHCKNMAQPFSQAAKSFSPTSPVRFAEVDCTVHQGVCSDHGVQGYPTIKVFVNGRASDYNGGRSAEDFISHMRQQESKVKPVPKPVELLNQAQLDACMEESICVFASLPDIRDSSVTERQNYIKTLTQAAEKTKRHPIAWVYSFARNHRELENSLQMGQNGFPAIVLLHKGKSIYSPMYRAFTVDAIYEWANKAGNNQVTSASAFKNLPTLETVAAWDGKGYVAPKEEL